MLSYSVQPLRAEFRQVFVDENCLIGFPKSFFCCLKMLVYNFLFVRRTMTGLCCFGDIFFNSVCYFNVVTGEVPKA